MKKYNKQQKKNRYSVDMLLANVPPDPSHGNDADVNPISEKFYMNFWAWLGDKSDLNRFAWAIIGEGGDAQYNYSHKAGQPYPSMKEKFYRGETILTTTSTLGRAQILDDGTKLENDYRVERAIDEAVDWTIERKDHLRMLAKTFRNLTYCLANFMPMWRIDRPNLNCEKGTYRNEWHDYPDTWLRDIRKWYLGEELPEKAQRIFDENAEGYFGEFGNGEIGWENYVRKNYIEDFMQNPDTDQVFIPQTLFEGPRIKYQLTAEQIESFLENSIRIINARAKRLAHVAE